MKHTLRERTPHSLILEYPDLDLLEEQKSPYQHIAVYRHKELGKILAHDNIVMLVSAYEAAYHEMIAHIPLLHHVDPKRVLLIGGGDGGTAKEVLRHPQVQEVVQVEIDGWVIDIAKKHFPELAISYEDARLDLHIADGIEYVRSCAHGDYEGFDIILVDSSDPIGPAKGLFSQDFYENCGKILKQNGILVIQGETFYGMAHVQREIFHILRNIFCDSGMYMSAIPFYPLGTWNLIYASQCKRVDWNLRQEAFDALESSDTGLLYLNQDILSACFALPNYALFLSGVRAQD